VTLHDAWGTPVTVDKAPEAIVSLTLATDEILVELVDPKRLAAIDSFSADPGISNISAFAQTFPNKISGERETILALRPDLVLVADWKERDFIQTLRDAGLRVFVVKAPETFAQLRQAVTALAVLVGEPGRGKDLLDKIDRRLAAIDAKVESIEPTQRLTVLAYSFSGTTLGRGTSFDALVSRAGLINAAGRAGIVGWPSISKEQILQLDPDIIALPSWSYDGKNDANEYRDRFLKDPVFSSLKAVKSKRVVVFSDRHMDSNSQYMVDGVEDLAGTAWPQLFR